MCIIIVFAHEQGFYSTRECIWGRMMAYIIWSWTIRIYGKSLSEMPRRIEDFRCLREDALLAPLNVSFMYRPHRIELSFHQRTHTQTYIKIAFSYIAFICRSMYSIYMLLSALIRSMFANCRRTPTKIKGNPTQCLDAWSNTWYGEGTIVGVNSTIYSFVYLV